MARPPHIKAGMPSAYRTDVQHPEQHGPYLEEGPSLVAMETNVGKAIKPGPTYQKGSTGTGGGSPPQTVPGRKGYPKKPMKARPRGT